MIRNIYILLLFAFGFSQDSTYFIFEYTGSYETWEVPNNINKITISAYAAQEKLLAQIKADQQLYDAIKASELVDEMEQKVEEYRQRKQ